MKNYVIYQFKKAALPFAVVAFAGLLFYVMPLLLPITYNFTGKIVTYCTYLAIMLIAACILMPLWAFRYKMNRRSTDLYFSLPIKRHKLLLVHYVSGFAAIFAAYTAIYWLGFIVIAVKAYGLGFEYINMLWLYLTTVAASAAVYSIYSFAYTRANNIVDGLIFMVFATVALMLIALVVYTAAWTKEAAYYETDEGEIYSYNRYTYYVTPSYYMPFTPVYILAEHFARLAAGKVSWYFTPLSNPDNVNLIISIVLLGVLGAASGAGLVLLEKRNKSENCEQNSDSIFGYKIMIPLCEFTLCAATVTEGTILLLLIVIAAGYFATAIWKRSFKTGWKSLIVLAASAAAGIITGGIIYLIK